MNYDKIIRMLKEKAAENKGNGVTFNDYIDVINNSEVKAFLDNKFKDIQKINQNHISNKNYLLKELLEIYFMENDVEIIEEEVDNEYQNAKDIDILNIYLTEIGKYKVYTREEEIEVFTKYNETKDPYIREDIVKHNLRFVVNIAKKYGKYTEDGLKDAIQDGSEGLLIAIERFDVTKGNKFSTFAHWWITQYIRRNLINNGRMIRLPVHFAERLNKMNNIINKYIAIHGVEPTDEYLAKEMDIPIEKIKVLKRDSIEPVSTDTPVGEDEHGEESILLDFIEDPSTEFNVEKKALYSDLKEQLKKSLDNLLKEREREIVSMRYGLEDNIPHTLEEVGERYGLTRERIRQIEFKALKKIRKKREDLKDYLR